MPNLRAAQKTFDNLLARISDEETKDRYEAASEVFWNDQVTLEEMIEELREELRLQRLF